MGDCLFLQLHPICAFLAVVTSLSYLRLLVFVMHFIQGSIIWFSSFALESFLTFGYL